MTWERFFLLALVAMPIKTIAVLLWLIVPGLPAYVLAIGSAAVVTWHGKRMYDEAVKEIRIRNGSFVP